MSGSTSVDFAGTLAEAKIFAQEHRAKFPRTFNVWRKRQYSPNGHPMLYAAWKNNAERLQVRDALVKLGWDPMGQLEVQHDAGKLARKEYERWP